MGYLEKKGVVESNMFQVERSDPRIPIAGNFATHSFLTPVKKNKKNKSNSATKAWLVGW